MQNSWIVLVPPILVLIVAFYKKHVILSLVTGIISAALIASDFSIVQTLSLAACRIFEETNIQKLYCPGSPDHLYTFAFLIILGIIISLITHTGGIAIYSQILGQKLKTKKATESTSLVLSLLFFIDDYLNSLTVGCAMRPLTDRLSIPRAKLAFLLDSMSSPLCVLIPASSWVALILTQLQTSGVTEQISGQSKIIADPFIVYLKSITYMFYPIILIASAWFIVRKQISFGPMYDQDQIASKTGNLFGGKAPIIPKVAQSCSTQGSLLDFILPIGSFLFFVIILLLYSGNWYYLGGKNSIISAIQEANPFYALFLASLISLIISCFYFRQKNKLNLNSFKLIVISGFDLMKNSLWVLILAWTLGSILAKDLGTGQYLANLMLHSLPTFLLPLIIFITSLAVSAGTGSAWGTIAIITPLAIPAVVAFTNLQAPISIEQAYLLYPVVGALISGSIAGGHVSPISDATVMSSTSAGCYHIDHVTTQIPYVIPMIIGSSVSLIISGLLASYNQILALAIALPTGIIISFVILALLNKNK